MYKKITGEKKTYEGDVHLSHDFRSVVYQSMDRLYTSWRTCTQEKCNSL
jgi:hypothetical protein